MVEKESENENSYKQTVKLPVTEKPKSSIDASFWIALVAIFISVATAFISLYEANLMKNQQRIMMEQKNASAWPYIQISPFYRYERKKNKVTSEISIRNKGVGPAILGDIQIYLNNQEAETYNFVNKLQELYPDYEFKYERNQQLDNSVISAGEEIIFLGYSLTYKDGEENKVNKILNNLDAKVEFCYCSIYKDCWRYDVDKQGEYDRCE